MSDSNKIQITKEETMLNQAKILFSKTISLVNQMISSFAPQMQKEEDRNPIPNIVLISICLIVACFIYIPLHIYMDDPIGVIVTALAGFLVISNLVYLHFIPKMNFAKHIPTLAFYAVVTGQSFALNGIEQPGLGWFSLTSLIALFTAGIRAAIFWAYISALTVFGLFLMSLYGFTFPHNFTLSEKNFYLTTSTLGTILFVLLFGITNEVLKNRAYQEIFRIANVDILTGVHNRRRFFQLAKEMFESNSDHFAVLFDIDHFKSINDRFGHAAGDQVLKVFADCIRSLATESTIFGRIGGEEFAMVMTGKDEETIIAYINQMRMNIENLNVPIGEHTIRFTMSCGISRKTPVFPDLDHLLHQVDEALYEAKRTGRNRVIFRA